MALSKRAQRVRRTLFVLLTARKLVQVAGIMLAIVFLFTRGWMDALLTLVGTGSLSYMFRKGAALYEARHLEEIAEITANAFGGMFRFLGKVFRGFFGSKEGGDDPFKDPFFTKPFENDPFFSNRKPAATQHLRSSLADDWAPTAVFPGNVENPYATTQLPSSELDSQSPEDTRTTPLRHVPPQTRRNNENGTV